MEIVAAGFCTDCDTTVGIDFDEESGAAYCTACGSYEVEDIVTDETDDDDDDDTSFYLEELDDEDDEDYEDGMVIDDEF